MNKISYDERVRTYTNAFISYGERNQLIVAIEELSECQKELCKILRGNGNMDHLAEEIADATICLEQMRFIFGLNDLVCQKMDEKVLRLDNRLKYGLERVTDKTITALKRMGANAHGGADNKGETELLYGSSPCTHLPVRKV